MIVCNGNKKNKKIDVAEVKKWLLDNGFIEKGDKILSICRMSDYIDDNEKKE